MKPEELKELINEKGNQIRQLKEKKDNSLKEEIATYVKELIELKNEFKDLTGEEYPVPKPTIKKEKNEIKVNKNTDHQTDSSCVKKSKKQLNKEKKKEKKVKEKLKDKVNEHETPLTENVIINKKEIIKDIITLQPEEPRIFYQSTMEWIDLPIISYVISHLLNKTNIFIDISKNKTDHISIEEKELEVPILYVPKTQNKIYGDTPIALYLARQNKDTNLYNNSNNNNNNLDLSEIDIWMDLSKKLSNHNNCDKFMGFLNKILIKKTFLHNYHLSLADISVWKYLVYCKENKKKSFESHINRYYTYLISLEPFQTTKSTFLATNSKTVEIKTKQTKKETKSDEINKSRQLSNVKDKVPENKKSNDNNDCNNKNSNTGSCPPLEGAIEGEVVTRFPPEPSGFLHIGHVKACMLNDYYAKRYKGKLILRFDDTNPSKEKIEYEENIIKDLKKLDIVPNKVTYTSDSFDILIDYAYKLINENLAYMDDTKLEIMRQERMDGIESKNRESLTVQENLALFKKLFEGDEKVISDGYCLRAKIDMKAKNKTLRDPVLFRSNITATHHRTGNKYKAYPTYDFACPIVDSIEGVTHALRTTEYNDRDAQYQWFLEKLKLRKVRIHSFARMNFIYTVLSKRKLQYFVDNKLVDGWNDPRFPTVQGVLRRGVQVQAIRDFIISQGASRRITDMEWDKFYTINKRMIDPIAKRYFAINNDKKITLVFKNYNNSKIVTGFSTANHPKDPSLGNKILRFSHKLFIEYDDGIHLNEQEEITLMRYGNVIIDKIIYNNNNEMTKIEIIDFPTGDFKKTKKKITWLSCECDLVPVDLIEFDHIITKTKLEENDNFTDFINNKTIAKMMCLGEQGLRNCKEGNIIQLERRGYFRVDRPYISDTKPLVLFMIPDGKVKAMSTLTGNFSHR